MKKLIILVLFVPMILLGCTSEKNISSNLDTPKIILNTDITSIEFIKLGQPAYIKKFADLDNMTKITDKLKKIQLNNKLDEAYKGWVFSLTLIGENKQTILFLGDKIYIDSSWYSVDKEVVDDIEKLYKDVNCNEEEYNPIQ